MARRHQSITENVRYAFPQIWRSKLYKETINFKILAKVSQCYVSENLLLLLLQIYNV